MPNRPFVFPSDTSVFSFLIYYDESRGVRPSRHSVKHSLQSNTLSRPGRAYDCGVPESLNLYGVISQLFDLSRKFAFWDSSVDRSNELFNVELSSQINRISGSWIESVTSILLLG